MSNSLYYNGAFPQEIQNHIRLALAEDIGTGDVTTNSIVPKDAGMRGRIIAKQNGIVAGLDVANCVYKMLEKHVNFKTCIDDGSRVENRQVLACVSGPARVLLTAERTALNYLGRMSGIATLTNKFVEAIAGTGAVILDTRKTAPGMRLLDKLAVRCGGGQNHRLGLYDMVLIKDNHIEFAGSLEDAVYQVRQTSEGLEIEVEARTLDDVSRALRLRVERILLDNMSAATMRQAVLMNAHQAKLEASGNVTLANVRQVAETGVDFISTGALTHSVIVFDMSFEYLD